MRLSVEYVLVSKLFELQLRSIRICLKAVIKMNLKELCPISFLQDFLAYCLYAYYPHPVLSYLYLARMSHIKLLSYKHKAF